MDSLLAASFDGALSSTGLPDLLSGGASSEGQLADWLTGVARECGFDRQPIQIRRHRKLFRPGDHDKALYLVIGGLVATVVAGRGSRKCITHLAGPGDILGELSLAPQLVQEETAMVLRDAVVVRIPTAAVLARLGTGSQRGLLLVHFAQRLAQAQAKLAVLLKCNAEQRLALALIGLAGHGWRGDEERGTTPPLTQQELADLIGTTRTRVCTFICQFRDHGLIEVAGDDRYVVDHAGLRAHVSVSRPRRIAPGRFLPEAPAVAA